MLVYRKMRPALKPLEAIIGAAPGELANRRTDKRGTFSKPMSSRLSRKHCRHMLIPVSGDSERNRSNLARWTPLERQQAFT